MTLGFRRVHWWESVAAIAIGNVVYFLLLAPHLPAAWQHQPFLLDRGLLLDFALCGLIYGLLRAGRAAWHNPGSARAERGQQ